MSYISTFATNAWLQSILFERFGKRFILEVTTQGAFSMRMVDSERTIAFAANFETFSGKGSSLPCAKWDAAAEGWHSVLNSPLPAPGSASLPSPLITSSARGMHVAYDILGLTYWMLTRKEELGSTELDEHGRFPATASHAFRHDYLDRPVVDEWLNILRQVIECTWPGIILKQHNFSMQLSHDVDQPSLYAFKPWVAVARMMAGHLIKRKDFRSFITAPYVKLFTQKELIYADPFNTFDWLMDVSERNNIKSTFYFICGRTNAYYDADYELGHPVIRSLMRRIHRRDHKIGLHPSYNTYQDIQALKKEADHLRSICNEEGIYQAEWGARMHYLRWQQSITPYALDYAGLSYDASLGYADHIGFRCGTCFEYPTFDPVSQKELTVRSRPLIMMEGSLIAEQYMGQGSGLIALQSALALKDKCRSVGGQFSLLWHNSYLETVENRSLLMNILEN